MDRNSQIKLNEAMVYFMPTDHKHVGCFRCNPEAEGDKHIRAKFERWLMYRKESIPVCTEMKFVNGKGKPDLVLPLTMDIEEILVSEKQERFEAKDYSPFKVKGIRI